MKRQPEEKINYLYARLSKEDARYGESMSIENQRKMLTEYAEAHGLTPYTFVFDDGYSGTDWDRPAFNQILADTEAGKVASLAFKDLSRLGRAALRVGFYTEMFFPQYDVRVIATEENVDSDMAPIINIFNEWHVKTTSEKIRAVWQSKGRRGERLAVIPIYGYRKQEGSGNQLIIDEESAAVVRRIFQMCKDGLGGAEIARRLMVEHILNPSAYKYERGIMKKLRPMKDPYLWNTTTIHKILDAPEYLGITVNFKTWSKNYKDHKCRTNPEEKRLVFEGTHEAIIDPATWEVVRKMRQTKRRSPRYGEVGTFTGLVYCADCGAKLYYSTRELKTKKGTRYEGAYSCSEYRKAVQYQGKRTCTCHYISEVALTELVLESLRQVLSFARGHEREFAKLVMEQTEAEQKRGIAAKKRQMAQKAKRVDELDTLFERLYEDSVSGKITEERFVKLSAKYEDEQAALKSELATWKEELAAQEAKLGDVDKFMALVARFTDIQELTPAIANSFIDRIIVHEPTKARGNRVQQVDIIYNGVGELPAEALKQAA
jgi:DNA invertase Pin-like site-specific DNA recombinase